MKKLILIFVFALSVNIVKADAPGFEDDDIPGTPTENPPGGGVGIPIDGGISFFLIGAGVAGASILGFRKRK